MKKNKLEFKFKNKFKKVELTDSQMKTYSSTFLIFVGKPSQLNSYNNFKKTLINDGNYFIK